MYNKYALLIFALLIVSDTSNAHWLPFLNYGSPTTTGIDNPEISAQNKMMRDMNFDELEYTKNKHLAHQNYEVALKYLEKMIPLCENLEKEARIRLELADLLYTCEKYKNAELHYRQFYQLYKNDVQTEYALYRALCCCVKQLCEPSRDQGKTVEAIELADEFLSFETFTTYAKEVQEVRKTCQRELLKSGISIFKDYVCRKHFKSAYSRLKLIKKTFSSEFENLDEVIAQLEQEWSDAAGIPYPRQTIQEHVAAVNLAAVSHDTSTSMTEELEEADQSTLVAQAS